MWIDLASKATVFKFLALVSFLDASTSEAVEESTNTIHNKYTKPLQPTTKNHAEE